MCATRGSLRPVSCSGSHKRVRGKTFFIPWLGRTQDGEAPWWLGKARNAGGERAARQRRAMGPWAPKAVLDPLLYLGSQACHLAERPQQTSHLA